MDAIIALVYRRVSTYAQERDGVSLDVQDEQCIDYIRRNPGWRLGGDFQDTLTGRTAKRRDYQRLLEEVRQLREQGQQVVVVTAALDRMGRDLEESVRARKELRGREVLLHCIREGGVLSELQANLLATIAQDESERTSARVKGSRKHNRERGYRSPGRVAWGCRRAAATEAERLAGAPATVLRVDPVTAPYVREAWRRLAAGETVRQVARWAGGLPSDARGGRQLDYPNVRKVFANAVYIGRVAEPTRHIKAPDLDALTLPRGRWEPLIDDEMWVAGQEQIGRHQRMPRQASGTYLLTGLLRCARCGRRMQGCYNRGVYRYVCGTPSVGCWYGGRVDVIEREVVAAIMAILAPLHADAAIRAGVRAAWAKLQKPPDRPNQRRVATLERLIARARRRQDEMLALLADKVITREKYARADAAEQVDIDAAQRELAEIRATDAPPVLPALDDVIRTAGGWAEILAGADMPARRNVLGDLVEEIVPHRVERGKFTVDVTWTPLGRALRQLSDAIPDGRATADAAG